MSNAFTKVMALCLSLVAMFSMFAVSVSAADAKKAGLKDNKVVAEVKEKTDAEKAKLDAE